MYAEEEYYKNDYPEEENSSSDDSDSSGASFVQPSPTDSPLTSSPDMFHERSDYEEMLEEDSFDEREWR